MGKILSPIKRFFNKVEIIPFHECWEWTASINTYGYGKFSFEGKDIGAHRFSLMLHNVILKKDLVVDHICRNRSCVNPRHLRQVTPRINSVENSVSITAINFKKTNCPKGHEYDLICKGSRFCRQCSRESYAKRKSLETSEQFKKRRVRINAQRAKYYLENKDKIRQKAAIKYQENCEVIKAKANARYHLNKGKK